MGRGTARSAVEGLGTARGPSTMLRMCWCEIVPPGHDLGLPGAVQSSNTLPTDCGRREDLPALQTPHPRREGEEGPPVGAVGVAALMLAEGEPAAIARLADRGNAVADEAGYA